MKATQGTTYNMLGSRLNSVAQELENLRSIGATGKKLQVASDDPAAIRPVLNTRKQISNIDRYIETMGNASDIMNATDGNLEHVENIMQRAEEIMVNAINGSLNSEDRQTLANELEQLTDELLDAANANIDGKYIFAGYQEDTKPFEYNTSYDPALYDPDDHRTWPVVYNGDDNATELEIATGERLEVNLTGNNLFMGTSVWREGPYDSTDADPTNDPNAIDSGMYNLFTEMTQAAEAIRADDDTAMQTALDDIQGAAEQNRRLRSQLGNRATRVESAMAYQEDVKVDLQQVLSRYEDADAIEVFNDIVQQETAFQAALSITGKVSALSILDYI